MNEDIVILIALVLIGVPIGIAVLVYLVVPTGKGVVRLLSHVGRFVVGELGDALRIVGTLITSVVLVPLTVGNVVIGRWSGAGHYGRAIQTELKALGGALYRVAIGHPARLLCLSALTEGLEQRIPAAVALAPGADKPPRRVGQFEGYDIVGSLPGGGSGGKLYIADPSPEKLAAFVRMGIPDVKQVVIKSFSLRDGSSLPQIVRENRALPAAKRLGLILEHDLTEERFFYVMRYVPGESLGLVTQKLHAQSGPEGLNPQALREAVEYVADLARTLCHYHDGGLWHKDVKPDNIIVAGGQAHLVDFGLITPLRSSMTLTTHGTEYFRDPEMVRMALRGVKVHEVDGAKFDIYAAGAVLYSIVENSFPAHGGLSQISKRCPEALRWVVRRAMTDYDKRYANAAALLADLEAIAAAGDPFAMKPAMLPSFGPSDATEAPIVPEHVGHAWEAAAPPSIRPAAAGLPIAAAGLAAAAALPAGARPRLRVTSWWSGKYAVQGLEPAAGVHATYGAAGSARVPGATAAEQRGRARERARAARARAQARMERYSASSFKPVNAGVGLAVLAFLVFVGVVAFIVSGPSARRGINIVQNLGDGTSRTVRIGMNGVNIQTGVEETNETPVEELNHLNLPVTRDPAIRTLNAGHLGQFMVLRDHISFESAYREMIDAQLVRLAETGYRLRGNPEVGPEGVDQAEEELIAELRIELGVMPFSSADARSTIERWLEKYPNISGVVWIGRGDDASPTAWVVGRRDVKPQVVDDAARVFAAAAR